MICFNFQIFNFFHCSYPMGLLSFWKYIKIMNDKYLHINYLLPQLTVACNTRSLIRFVRTTVVGIPDTTFFNSIVVAHTRKYMDCISIPLPELSIWTSTWLTFPHVHLNTGERERGGERKTGICRKIIPFGETKTAIGCNHMLSKEMGKTCLTTTNGESLNHLMNPSILWDVWAIVKRGNWW